MSILAASILGLFAVMLAVPFKGKEGEYGIWMVMAAGLILFFYGAAKIKIIMETVRRIQSYVNLNGIYLTTLFKMAGITYIAEFASGICKDAGYGAIGTQIEIFAKLSILAVSMPVLAALLETMRELLG